MKTSQGAISFKKPAFVIAWELLLFLVLFMDVKLAVKAFALVFIYILQPDLKFGFRIRHSRLPLFYLIAIFVAILNFIIYRTFSADYLLVVCTGLLIWVGAIMAIHQIKLIVERTDLEILHNTLFTFFILNIAFSLLNMAIILIDVGFRNPFLYQGLYQKYFINTGDFIKGVTADSSTTNALINCFGIVYFLYQEKYLMVITCMSVLLMTASNFSNIILVLVFLVIFLLRSTREQKSIMIACITMMVIYFAKLSPQNEIYLSETLNKYFFNKSENIISPKRLFPASQTPESLNSTEKTKAKTARFFLDSLAGEEIKMSRISSGKTAFVAVVRPEIPKDKLDADSFQWKRDTTLFQRQLYSFIQSQEPQPAFYYPDSVPGKVLALRQSLKFLQYHPVKIITGDGIGNFSSKLAFRATGLKMEGGFPPKFIYCNPDFLANHLNLYAFFYLKTPDSHSLIHNPASVYDQLLTEYGLVGFIAFPFCYLGFFCRQVKKLTYGLPLVLLLIAFFTVDYWFEKLSVVVLFELMMFMNMKQHTQSNEQYAAFAK